MQKEDSMDSSKEARILKVSEMLTRRFMESARDFVLNTADGHTAELTGAMYLLEPEIQNKLEPALERMMKANNLSEELMTDTEVVKMETAYAIGIVAGLHLAGRADLVATFAKLYAEGETFGDKLPERYNNDGSKVEDRAAAH